MAASSSEYRIPLSVPDLRGREAELLAECVRDNWVSSAGPFVAAFEAKVAGMAGRAHGVAACNGTAALELLLMAAGVERGAFVIVPDYTFAATANAVMHLGAMPVFVDVLSDSWTLDHRLVAAELADRSIAAVIAVHALGHPADMDALGDVCAKAGVPLIEDAAGAIGARYKGRPAGGLADAAMFSFNGNKTVTAGGGGMIVTDNAAWAEKARALSTQARMGGRYRYHAAGYNYRMTNVNAAIGLAQLERLPEMLAAKHRIAACYDAAISGRDDLVPMPRCAWAESGCWLYSVQCADDGTADELVAVMNAAAIEARHFWETLSDQMPYANAPRRLSGVAAGLSGTVVSLPCSTSLSADEQARVVGVLARWRGRRLKEAA